jgi:hypothetical protein
VTPSTSSTGKGSKKKTQTFAAPLVEQIVEAVKPAIDALQPTLKQAVQPSFNAALETAAKQIEKHVESMLEHLQKTLVERQALDVARLDMSLSLLSDRIATLTTHVEQVATAAKVMVKSRFVVVVFPHLISHPRERSPD